MGEGRSGNTPQDTVAGVEGPFDTSERRFKLLVESVVDYGIFILDPRGHVSSWNAGAGRMKGYTAAEILGQHFSVFYPPEDVAAGKCERELKEAVRDGRFEDAGWRVRKDGSRFWANVIITPLFDADGTHIGFGKVTRDLTERRTAEEELRLSEERLRLLIASVSDYAIFVLDPSGRVATWNAGAERLKGYTASEIIGQHFSRFYPEADVRAGKCEIELAGAVDVGRYEDEGWRVRKDGTQFWANVVITPIRDEKQRLVGFAKVTRDLTERRRHEEERIQLVRAEEGRRVAEEATRLKDEFLATVSHELRTPLNAILGWARMLSDGGLPLDKQAHAIDTIVRNAVAQNQIIDDLLDVSRIITGQLRLEVEPLDLNQIVTSAIDVVRHSAEAKGVEIAWQLNAGVRTIKGDAGRLQQVLWNLLTNAVKFTPRGGRVSVDLRREQSSIEIEIVDTGAGIAEEFLPRVFERFSQAETGRTRRSGGLGLGLAIVKHLVELHGGTVEAHSEGKGKGCSFVIRLPVAPERPATAEPRLVTHAGTRTKQELEGLVVLVLDDETDARELVQAVLEHAGARVVLAASVAEALETIAADPKPDVVVSDIGMPVEDGYSFMRRLRALPHEDGGRIPALALTAYARPEDRRKALVAGFQHHATKPIEPQELLVVVANLAGRFT